ncbi:sensor histidine kinase [Cryptosporangium arvum]|uniref:sensor histidine kinase n=1 Tax=Cryptosporangium arvum TaxID=80871 RepID=UPI0004B71B33|nr:nitrate- and nitrite sensing domain-containing protein [Cryptosporangium arvum]
MSERSGGSIGRRIVRTLALPIAAVVALLAVVAVAQVGDVRSAAATSRAVTLGLAVQDLVQELQTERGVTAGFLGGNAGFRAELTPVRRRVDARRAEVTALTGGGDRSLARALRALDGLAGIRAGADSGSAPRAPAFAFYTARIAALTTVDIGFEGASDATLRREVAALQALTELTEATAQARAILNGVFSAGGFRGGEFLQFVTARSTADAAAGAFARHAGPAARDGLRYLFDTGAAREAVHFQALALGAGDGRYLQVNPQSWWSALTTVLDDLRQLRQHVGSVIQARADTLRDSTVARMAGLLGAALLALLGSVYLAVRASRSIARPLAALAGEADRLATTRLPAAVRRAAAGQDTTPPSVGVPAEATDEVHRVAAAFDRVQATAHALAVEQARLRRSSAESLANLGRRNQNLLRRQLGFISRLEREESDPAGLANLFELDHLATRMRRNAESLLVLVGAASPRQWSDPLPVTDVIRAAVSEVEEYRRVVLRRVDDVLVSGAVVSGVAHALAELIENGLSFSPPDVEVEIHGRRLPDGYLIAVFDQGVGLGAAELERANERLRGDGDFITAPARFLGHYVVGRLAVELGFSVQLAASPVTGVTARVMLPASVLAEAPAVPVVLHRYALPVEGAPPAPALAGGPPSRAERLARAATAEAVVRARGRGHSDAAAALDGPHLPAAAVPGASEDFAPVGAEVAAVPGQRDGGVALYAVDGDGERTRNGLRKRTPRARTPVAPAAPVGERPALLEESPGALRARLSAFRDGVHRGTSRSDSER